MRVLPSGGIVCEQQNCGCVNRSSEPLISLVVPMYNEAAGLEGLFAAIEKVAGTLQLKYEVVCVDDGSTDGTYETLLEKQYTNVRAFRLSRNYGKETALSAGLDLANGDVVIPMDADLQEPPALIGEMLEKWRNGYDVVFAVRRSRQVDGKFKAGSAKLFYKFFNAIADSPIPENVGDFRLMDRRVVDVLKQMPERNRFMKGLLTWPGFRSTQVYFDRPDRYAGESKWKPHKLMGLAMDGLTSFSIFPLRVASLLGGCISLASFLFGIYVIVKYLLFGDAVQGYASLIVTMVFLGGVQLLALGIVGEYIGRIYVESKHRPLYVIMDSSEMEQADSGKSGTVFNAR